jgi:PTS system mannitol-specific IIC component
LKETEAVKKHYPNANFCFRMKAQMSGEFPKEVRWSVLQVKKETATFAKSLTAVRKVGHTLSEMVMPNLSIFIAWGLLSMASQLFFGGHTTKFLAIEKIMLYDLLPILISYTGGKVIGGNRGGVVGAMATVGVIAGSSNPQVFGAMLMGPIGGFCFKKAEQMLKRFIKPGYEMLIRNLSAGIISGVLCYLGIEVVAPLLNQFNTAVAAMLAVLVQLDLLPLLNIFIEPLKVLFLNNALNHGIFTPLGIENVETAGKSILFLLEANPGPGLGVLLAFTLFGNKKNKVTSGGALLIQLVGGLHEIYFPFVLSDLRLFFAVILGGTSGSFIFQLFGSGLTGPASPGSIVTIFANAPTTSYFGLALGIVVSTSVSFLVSSVIVKSQKQVALPETPQQKGAQHIMEKKPKWSAQRVTDVLFVCDAGMGSSAMGASLFRHLLVGEKLATPVHFTSIYRLEDQEKRLVVTQPGFVELAKQKAPHAMVEAVDNFLNEAAYEALLTKYFSANDTPPTLVTTAAGSDQVTPPVFIFLYSDPVRGSQTMAVAKFQQLARNLGVAVVAKKAPLTQKLESEATYVVTQDFAAAHPDVRKLPHLVVVDHWLLSKKYQELLKAGA